MGAKDLGAAKDSGAKDLGAEDPSERTSVAQASEVASRIVDNVCLVLEGKRAEVELAVVALIAGGHLLIEDVPGVGKTTLARALARSVGVPFRRLQFTSDLMPADVVGTTIYKTQSGEFEFKPGPVFTNVLLADEINRTTPKTQSALLEAMGERRVSIDGRTHELEPPFFVVATQNPEEFYGTYPLPESQLDRFLLRLRLGYPPPRVERAVLARRRGSEPIDSLEAVSSRRELLQAQAAVDLVRAEPPLLDYLHEIVLATRASEHLELGASTRAAIAFERACRANALVAGRDFATPRRRQTCRHRGLGPSRSSAGRTRARRGSHRRLPRAREHPGPSRRRRVKRRAKKEQRRARSTRSRPRRLKFTREGRVFVLATVGIGAAAVNTGNNLLYLILGLLLSLIIVSGVLSELVLRKLTIARHLPSQAFANGACLVGLTVKNDKARVPSYSLELEDFCDDQVAAGELVRISPVYLLKVEAGGAVSGSYACTPTRRGVLRLSGVTVKTRYPFGLFEKSRTIGLADELVVYPELLDEPGSRAALESQHAEHEARRRIGHGLEVAGLREHVEGDDARAIHWTRTAALGRPVVRERHRDSSRRLTIEIDDARPPSADARWEDSFERSIRRAASRAWRALERGASVEVVTESRRSARSSAYASPHAIWTFLATLEPSPADPPPS